MVGSLIAGVAVAPTVADATTPREQTIVNVAHLQVGKPYLVGGVGPSGFDCSGLVDYTYRHGVGIALPRTSAAIYASLPHESAAQAQPGDVVAFLSGGTAYHVGIVYSVANHWMIVAAHPGTRVEVQSWNWGGNTVRFAYAPTVHVPPAPPAYLAPIRAATPGAAYDQAFADYRLAAAARASGAVLLYLMDQVVATQAVVLHTVGTATARAAYDRALAAYRAAAAAHASAGVLSALSQRVIYAQSTYTGKVVARI
jgi:hypothetical protein